MTDIVLRDIDAVLADRLRRLAERRGLDMHDTLFEVIEQGLCHCEAAALSRFDDREATALQQAIAALEQVPDDSGFGRIGRAGEHADQPDGEVEAG
jgi:hypothetical protein